MAKNRHIGARFTKKETEKFKALCEKLGINASDLYRNAIFSHISNNPIEADLRPIHQEKKELMHRLISLGNNPIKARNTKEGRVAISWCPSCRMRREIRFVEMNNRIKGFCSECATYLSIKSVPPLELIVEDERGTREQPFEALVLKELAVAEEIKRYNELRESLRKVIRMFLENLKHSKEEISYYDYRRKFYISLDPSFDFVKTPRMSIRKLHDVEDISEDLYTEKEEENEDCLFIKYKIIKYMHDKGYNVSEKVFRGDKLNDLIINILDKAITRAKANGRQMVLERDV